MFEPDDKKNPLLSKEELSFLRIGVNTISFYALSVGIGLQAALGQVAKDQITNFSATGATSGIGILKKTV